MTGTRSLVIAPQWIGDAVMSEPLMRLLASRGERLSVVALPWVAPVYRAMPEVSAVIEAPFRHGGLQWRARRELARSLAGQFDRAYVLPNSFKSALLPWLAGIALRIGRQGESRWGLLNRRLPNPAPGQRPPMVDFYLALAQSENPHAQGARPRLGTDSALTDSTLQAHGLTAGGYGVFAPGAEFGPAKRWPPGHYAALASLLGQTVVLLGSPKEAQDAQFIATALADAPVRCVNLIGRTRLPEAFALIGQARWVVSNDSGLMHLAAALGVPQVALYGSSSPLHTPPINPLARVLWLKNDASYRPALDCAPCFQRHCPLGHLRCLNDLSPDRVAREVASLGAQG
jgi:heptosyltransferase-2